MKTNDIKELKLLAANGRRNVLEMLKIGKGGHLGPAYSCMDIVAALYGHTMNVDPKDPKMAGRDIFLVSAGHKAMAQYAVMAELGFFDKAVFNTFERFGSSIPGHPCMHLLPGIEANTGSLGHGISLACGMALAKKLNGTGERVFVITGDGELAEGSNWEGAAIAAHYGLDNLTVIVDHNGLQISGTNEEVMNFQPITGHFAGFGWATAEINGNSMEEVVSALDSLPLAKGKPSLICANTTKGFGCSMVAGKVGCHFVAYSDELYEATMKELDQMIAEVRA